MSAWIPPIGGHDGRKIDAGLVLEDAWDAWLGLLDHRKWAKEVAIFSVMRQEFRRHAYEPFRMPVMEIAARAQMSRSTALPLLGEEVTDAEGKKKRGTLWDIHRIVQHLQPARSKLGALWSMNHPIMFRAYPFANDPDPEIVAARLGVPLRALIRAAEARLVARSEGEIQQLRVLNADLARAFTGKAARQVLADVALLSDLGEGPRDKETLDRVKQGQNRATRPTKSSPPTTTHASDDENSPSSTDFEEEQEEALDVDTELFIAAVEAKTGAAVFRPSSLLEDIKRLASRADLDTLLRAVEQAPASYGAPWTVKFVWRVVDSKIRLDPERTRVEAPVFDPDQLRRYALTLESEGEELPDGLRVQLEACFGADWRRGRIDVCDEVPA